MLGLASILLLGIGAQWLAWRLRLPSILLLLVFGFAVGPFTGHELLDPDALLGDSLLPFVSLSVAIILFEGGLTLRFRELRSARGAVRNLLVLGVPLTFVFATAAARWTLGIDWMPSALIGAILTVTGPTVIVPLLRHVRPSAKVASIVRWEGIVSDPIGAILAVLVFQVILHGVLEGEYLLWGLGKATLAGGISGLLAAGLLIFLLDKDLIPDFLHNAVALALALASFVASNMVQHESGLLAVTLMGIVLANQRRVSIDHIVEFKENLRVLLISTLFILLAARLPIEEFTRFDLRSLAFVVVLVVLVRPAMVFFSTIGTGLTWAEKAFVAWMAPRGIVAAAVASVFSLELVKEGVPAAERLVPVIFLVIIFTVTVYGLTAGPLARRLGLSKGTPNGVLLVGSHQWARKIAHGLKELGLDVLLVDTNHHETQAAKIEGLDSYWGSVFSEDFELTAPLDGIGNFLAVTHNDEVNSLACVHFTPIFGRGHTFQVSPEDASSRGDDMPLHLRGKVLFGDQVGFWTLESRFRGGAVVKSTRLSEEFSWEDFVASHEQEDAPVLPLFVLRSDGRLYVVIEGESPDPKPGDTVVAVVDSPT